MSSGLHVQRIDDELLLTFDPEDGDSILVVSMSHNQVDELITALVLEWYGDGTHWALL